MKPSRIKVVTAALLLAATASYGVPSGGARENEKGREAYLKRDYRAAEKHFRAAIKADPDSLWAHTYLGHSLYYQQRYDEAIPEYEKALRINAQTNEWKSNETEQRILKDQLGMSYGIGGHLDKAKSLFEVAIKEDPDFPMYYYNLACTLAEMGNLDEALSNIKQGLDRKSNMLRGETYPNPRTDDSFKKFLGNDKFEAAMKEMGF